MARVEYTEEMNNRLEEYKKDNYLSNKQLAEAIGVTPDTLYVTKRRKHTTFRFVKLVKDNLGIDIMKQETQDNITN